MKKLRSFKRRQKGFTLIELLIVVAILGVLAAVVIPNVVGLMGRGGAQAYETDQEVIQLSAATFYSDSHAGRCDTGVAGIVWSCNDTDAGTIVEPGHYYPTELAYVNGHVLGLSTTEFDDPNNPNNALIIDTVTGDPASEAQMQTHAIWMGLLVNEGGSSCVDGDVPADGDCDGTAVPGDAAPLLRETSLYLQEMPESAGTANGSTLRPGGYTWVVGNNGTVFGAYTTDGGEWYSGFSGGYP